MGAFLHVGLGGVLAEGTQALTHLVQLNLAIASIVEQIECFLEFYKRRAGKKLNLSLNRHKSCPETVGQGSINC